jgi:pyruvate kinase
MPERQMHSRTKIVATLGPSTDSSEVLTEMVRAGLDVARVNFSHGKHEEHGRRIDLVHEAARRAGRYVGILADLGGPKIRIESFTNKKVDLKDGQAFALDTAHDINAGNEQVVGCAYKELPKDVKAGNILLLNDGLIELEVTQVSGTRIDTKVIAGGELSNRKGVNLKGGGISAPALTDKDRLHQVRVRRRRRLRRRVFPARCRGHEPRARSGARRRRSRAPVRQSRASRGYPQPHRDHRRIGRRHGRAR